MRVTELMTRNVVSAAPDCPLDDAITLFETHPFRHLPVLEDGELVGIVSDRDIALATGWLRAKDRNRDGGAGPKNVGEVMQSKVHTLSDESSASEAAQAILSQRIGSIPVLRGRTVVGLVTSTDLLRASCELEGASDWKLRREDPVSKWMSPKVHTATPRTPLFDALDVCKNESVRHLPIVDDGLLVGIVSDRDLRYALGQEIVSDRAAQTAGRLEVFGTTLADLMVTDVTAADSSCSLLEALSTMLEYGFSALPVQKDGQLVGIITHTDILRSCC